MILDTLENLESYAPLNPLIKKVAEFVAKNDLSKIPQGKLTLQGEDLFGNFSLAKGKSKEEAKLETHNRMIDIQIPISGDETMGYTPRKNLAPQPYDEQKDLSLYDGLAEQYITVHQGQFAIFFPQDGHAPCVTEAESLQKVIFKLKA